MDIPRMIGKVIVMIIPGFVGAGAVVNQNVPDHALVVGNTAKQIGWVCRCGERLTESLVCEVCGMKYERIDSGIHKMD